jgi:hypothetical protein
MSPGYKGPNLHVIRGYYLVKAIWWSEDICWELSRDLEEDWLHINGWWMDRSKEEDFN